MYTLQEQLRDATEIIAGDVDAGDAVSFYNGYSGRGMYGDRCVGITGCFGDCMLVIADVIKEIREDAGFEDMVDTLLDFKQDGMGCNVIIYWPELEPIIEDEDDGQPDEEQEWHDFDPNC